MKILFVLHHFEFVERFKENIPLDHQSEPKNWDWQFKEKGGDIYIISWILIFIVVIFIIILIIINFCFIGNI